MLYKFNLDGLVFEASFPQNSNAKTIIILPGLPSYPRPKEIMERLSAKGYHVIYPRYSGTFESEGLFLKKSPSEDISKLLNELIKQRDLVELYAHTKMKIPSKWFIIVGTSFGGSIALEIAKFEEYKNVKFLVGCPVLDYKTHGDVSGEQDLKNLKRFLSEGFANIYRFKGKDFDRLIEGKVISSAYETKKFYGNITIFHGVNDEAVSFDRVKKFADLNSMQFVKLEDEGHLTAEKLIQIAENNKFI